MSEPHTPITDLSAKFLAAIEMAKAAGLKGNARVMAANNIVLKETGSSCLDMLGMNLSADNETPPPRGLDTVRAFVSACCLVGKCYFASRSTIYDAYSLYCSHSGITPEREQYFGKLLRTVVPTIGHLYQRDRTERTHCHTGLCLKECMDAGAPMEPGK